MVRVQLLSEEIERLARVLHLLVVEVYAGLHPFLADLELGEVGLGLARLLSATLLDNGNVLLQRFQLAEFDIKLALVKGDLVDLHRQRVHLVLRRRLDHRLH